MKEIKNLKKNSSVTERDYSLNKPLLIIGIICILSAIFLWINNIYVSNTADMSSQIISSKLDSRISKKRRNIHDVSKLNGIEMPSLNIDGDRYIGEIFIKKLNKKLPIMKNLDYDKLKLSPCRYSGSVFDKNLIIGGHNFRGHFGKISTLKNGDKIEIIDVDGNTYNYFVDKIEVINQSKLDLLTNNNDNWDLSLFTCTLSGNSRYVVRCKFY